jgi:hypothetical protein
MMDKTETLLMLRDVIEDEIRRTQAEKTGTGPGAGCDTKVVGLMVICQFTTRRDPNVEVTLQIQHGRPVYIAPNGSQVLRPAERAGV